MRGSYGALVGGAQPALEQGDDQMNMVQMFLCGLTSGAGDVRTMVKTSRSQFVIDRQAVGDDGCTKCHVISNERFDRLSVYRCHTAEANPAKLLLRIPFNSNKNQCLALCAASPLSCPLAAHIGFIHLDAPDQRFPPSPNHYAAKLLQPPPGGLVTPKPIGVTQIPGTQACLLSHHQPHDVKPQTQRLAAVLKHGSGCYRHLSVTTLAMQQPPRRTPRLRATTDRTRKAIRPSHPLQVGRTIILRREPVQNLLKCPRIDR